MSRPSFHKITPRAENEDDQTPEEAADQRRKRIWIIGACCVIVLGGIVIFNARTISRNIKAWQAERAATDSTKFLATKDYRSAQARVQDALALSPNNPAAQLATARFLSTAGSHRDAVGFWKKIEENSTLTPTDQRPYATSLLAMGDILAATNRLKIA